MIAVGLHPPTRSTSRRLREHAVQHDGVRGEEHGHCDRQARQVPLDDVRAALGRRREADAAEARVASRVHEHERDERGAEQHLEDGEDGDHRRAMVPGVTLVAWPPETTRARRSSAFS